MTRKLLVATHNPGKVREYREILADLPLEVTYLDAEGVMLDVDETGATFAENAILKATTYARLTGLWTWADDSGLEVDALGGAPGVYSARYAGPGASDADRYRKLLDALTGVPWDRRTARFRCTVAIAPCLDLRSARHVDRRRRVRGDHRVRAGGGQRLRLRPGVLPARARRDDGAASAGGEEPDQPPRPRGAGGGGGVGEDAEGDRRRHSSPVCVGLTLRDGNVTIAAELYTA